MKKPFIYLLTAGLAVSMIATSTTYAVENPTESFNSEATVTFEAPTDSVAPLDPENPENNLEENHDGVITESGGPLSLDYVSNLSFSTTDNPLEITSKTVNYETVSQKPFIQVSDFRGTGAGWRVTAAATPFNSDSEDGSTLIGSTISLVEGTTTSADSITSPTINHESVIIGGMEKTAIKLETNEAAQTIVTAEAKTEEQDLSQAPGQATWLMKWFGESTEEGKDPSVILTVLGNTASPGTHTSTITWTLENSPTGPVETQNPEG